ncbi:flavin-containing monooxygenase [Euzebya sp.]|uniref:flavin-containing monooxygenase n=1 Tax=Euzebya sp. TaxID=1971409 RepID=UPI0035124B04
MRPPDPLPRTCIIGAGSSGIAAAKALSDAGVPYDHFEASDRVGGNWAFENPNGMSSAYDTLHINTSRERMAFADFPMPRSFPTFPHHSHVARYFEDYVDHFGLRDRITFETTVERCERTSDGLWDVTLHTGETRRYDALLVANGHHWDPRWPEPEPPGTFDGERIHAHDYVRAEQVKDRRVVVVGMGNSAMDIATVASYVGRSSTVAARTPAHVVPKWWFGRPLDQWATLPVMHVLPWQVAQAGMAALIRLARGPLSRYGLPQPDHGLLQSHPTISSDFLVRAGHGAIDLRPDVARFDGDRVVFADGTSVEADLVIYATGYDITFPFFDTDLISAPDNQIDLYRNVVHPEMPNTAFIGLAQPLGAIMPIAERQSKWIAAVLTGRAHLPDRDAMLAQTTANREAMARRYRRAARHTIQVDFDDYMFDLRLEMWRGRRRAKRAGHTLQIPARATVQVEA